MGNEAHVLRHKALSVKKSLGTFCAARFLAKRGVSIQEAMMILAGTCIVRGGV
jgi:hypothetical protein